MKPFQFFMCVLSLVMALVPLGCSPSNESKQHGHEESLSGAIFKPSKGIVLIDETKHILGVETAEVAEEDLARIIRFNIQIFGETHRFDHLNMDHTGCDVHGSGFLPPDKAALVESKQPVKLLTADNKKMDGFVVAVQKQLAYDESEVIVGVTSAGAELVDGEFVNSTITLPPNKASSVIPKSALLRTAEGTFVYTLNGDAYYRTAVKVGGESEDKIEITDGLFAGDQVVIKSVETLWLIELRATKGGGHSH